MIHTNNQDLEEVKKSNFDWYLAIKLFQSQRTTNGISSTPFHTGFLSGQLWLQYGLLRHDKVFIQN